MPEELEELGKLNLKTAPPFFGRGEFGFFSIHIKNEGTRTFLEGFFLIPPRGPKSLQIVPFLSLSPQPPEVFQHQPTIQSTPRKKNLLLCMHKMKLNGL